MASTETSAAIAADRVAGHRYDAFVSYSHAVDGRLAPAVQAGLQSLAKPWYRRRVLRVFRDRTSLSASPELWPSIERSLGESRVFILFASPESAASRWVEQEVAWWRAHRERDTFFIALTGGSLEWDDRANDFRSDAAIPDVLHGWFRSEPLWVDLRWARTAEHISLRNPQFRDHVADLASPLHGVPKDALVGEDIRQHRRALRLAWSAVTALVLLTIAASTAAVLAVVARHSAIEQRDIARSRALAAVADSLRTSDPVLSLANALRAVDTRRTPEGSLALRRSLASPLRFDLHGQRGSVSSLVFSPDGRSLAQSGRESVVRVWDLARGGALLGLGGHREPNPAIGFARDGRHLVTASAGEGRVWDLAQPRTPRRFSVPAAPSLVSVTPNGETVAAADYDGRLVLASIQAPHAQRVLRRGGSPIHTLEFNGDGKRLLAVDQRGIWIVTVGSRRERLVVPAKGVEFASWTRTGGIVAVVGQSFAEYSGSGVERRRVPIRASPDSAIAVNGRERRVVVAGRALSVWDIEGDRPRALDIGTGGSVVASAPDGRLIAVASEDDGSVRIWDTDAVPLVPHAPTAYGNTAPVFSPDGRFVAADHLGNVKVWPVTGGEPRIVRMGGRSIVALAFATRGDRVLTISDDGYLRSGPAVGGRGRRLKRLGRVHEAAFSPDRLHAVTVDPAGTLFVWDLRHGTKSVVGRRAGSAKIAFAPDGRTIATTNGTSTLRIWSTEGGPARAIRVPAAAYVSAFDASGSLLAVPAGRSVYLWRLDVSSEPPRLLGRFGRFANAVAFSPRTSELVAGGTPGALGIWSLDDDVDNPLVLADGYSVDDVAYSPSGGHIAANSNGELHIWTCLACGSLDNVVARGRRLLPSDGGGLTAMN
jgi:WD40 repeat protein